MKLTRLRLLGFKSFVEPTDFLIEPGLTGVVGPNGCGKSNLVEALRWVMGEASHKAMRAADMDDVIFSGTNNRPARNNAEVAMVIDNTARKAPAQFNEHDSLDVSRRIEREAGLDLSHQRPRGAGPRRADPAGRRLDRLALAGAGAPGPHRRDHRRPSPSSAGACWRKPPASPACMRAGTRRSCGCAPPRHNLARLDDVINQLAGQIEALKRQAKQAVRYRVVAEQVRKAEATLVPSALGRGQSRERRSRARQGSGGPGGGGAHRRAGRGLHAASSRPPPGCRRCATREVARRRRAAALRDRARDARARGDPRQGAHRRARPAADPARCRYRARAAALAATRRRRSSGSPARRKRCSASRRPTRAQRAGADARVADDDAVLAAAEKTFARAHRHARRPHRAAQPARPCGARACRAAHPARDRDRRGRSRARDPQPARRARSRRARRRGRCGAGRGGRGRSRRGALGGRAFRRPPGARCRPPAARSRPSAACIVSTPRPRRSPGCCMWTPRICGPASSTLSRSTRASRPRSAPRSATISKRRSIPPRRCAGPAPPIEPTDPQLPEGVEPLGQHVRAPAELARRLAQIGVIDARGRGAPRAAAQAGPAAGLARWRSVALGRLCGRRQCADRRGAAARRQEPARRYRGRAQGAARGRRGQARGRDCGRGRGDGGRRRPMRRRAPIGASASTRRSPRASCMPPASARSDATPRGCRRWPRPRPGSTPAATRRWRPGAKPSARWRRCRRPPRSRAKLTGVRAEVEERRARLAEVRAQAQALAREAELAQRRLAGDRRRARRLGRAPRRRRRPDHDAGRPRAGGQGRARRASPTPRRSSPRSAWR